MMEKHDKTGLIGGTGFEDLAHVLVDETRRVDTVYGEPSSPLRVARWRVTDGDSHTDCPVVFLSRHGFDHRIPPHRVNYRANLSALKSAGCQRVVGIYAVGGIHEKMQAPGHVVIPDQIIDYTSGRIASYWDDDTQAALHVDFTDPYTPSLSKQLVIAAKELEKETGYEVSSSGVYAAVNGPRLESAAEIRRIARDGGDIVGMTGMPEAALARELALDFAALCVVVNPAAGLSDGLITFEMIESALKIGRQRVYDILGAFFAKTT
ncbi:MAG: S-methyl-5'-thioinosine phosphorylase [Gammaproteobacteria bacterium]